MTIKDKKWKYIKTYDTLIAPGVKLQDQICQLCPASNTSMVTPLERLPTGCCVFSIVQVKIYCTWILLWDALFLTFLMFSQFVSLLLNFFSIFCLRIALFCSFSHFFSFFLIFFHVISCDSYLCIALQGQVCSFLPFFFIFLHVVGMFAHVWSIVWFRLFYIYALPFLHLGCRHGCVAVVLWMCVCSQPFESQTGLKRLYSKLKLLGCCCFFLILIKWEKVKKKTHKWETMRKHEKMWEKVGIGEKRWDNMI